MKTFQKVAGLFGAVPALLLTLALAPASSSAQTGKRIQNFHLTDTAGKDHSLESYAGKIVVLDFWSFKCPVSLAYDHYLAAMQEKYRDRGVVVLAVASNSNESPVEIRRNVANLKLPFPVLLDSGGALAEELGATHTPSIFILDRAGVLRYRGAFDNHKEEGSRDWTPFADEALQAILAGRPVPQPETKVFGCSIKK